MSLLRPLGFLTVLLTGAGLIAQEASKETTTDTQTSATPQTKQRRTNRQWHKHSCFSASAQISMPLHDLKENLDRRVGYGLGAQWTHDHGTTHASRTRMEFNVFPESNPVGPSATKTYAKNFVLSFDHLFRLAKGPTHAYLLAGLGGVRWIQEQTPQGGNTVSHRATKLAVTGGIGVVLAEHVNLEARYVLSGVQKTFDSNVVQLGLAWHF